MLHATLPAALAHHALHSPNTIALHFEGQAISYSLLWQRVEVATARLIELGITPHNSKASCGPRVAYLGLNHPSMIVLLTALQRLGAVCLPLNYRLAPAELAAIAQHAQLSLLIADSQHADVASSLVPGLKTAPAALFDHAVPSSDSRARITEPPASTPGLLVYTSGTTGLPKGALHTQAAIAANCRISAHAHALQASDHVLTALPLFHVGGLCIQTLPALYAGATVTLQPRFEPSAWLAALQQRPSLSLMVPATLRAVLNHPRFAHTDITCLRMLSAGSSTIPLALITPWHARGVPVCQIYGATETGPVSIYQQAHEAIESMGCAGRAGLLVQVRLVHDGVDLPQGSVGEIWLRAPNVMQQYWRDEGHAALEDGWFRTGDLAHLDAQGMYTVVGRSKDMIISGGENIYPAELENILVNCPQIADCAVVGQSDLRWGEVAVAVIVRQPNSSLTEQEVLRLFDGQLARFKHPKRVVVMAQLPKTATGKVNKPQLLLQLGSA
jgi:fatty-acyl-CoA synthase